MRRAVFAFFWVLLAACSQSPQKNGATSTSTTTTEAPSNITATVDWRARTVEINGFSAYTIAFCEGAAPLLCVYDGEIEGVIELVSRREDTFDAKRFLDDIEADRHKGCPGYVMQRDSSNEDHYGFTGRLQNRIVERVVGVRVPSSSGLHLLVMNALADNGCLNRESELPLDVAKSLEPVLKALAKGSKDLPVT